MPFWTLLIAWPVLHERVRGAQTLAIAFALAGLVLVVEPWAWQGDLAPKPWAVLSGFGWAAGTVAVKYFQRDARLRHADASSRGRWLLGVMPLTLLPWLFGVPATEWSVTQALLLFIVGVVATAGRLPASGWKCCAGCPRARRRSTCSRFPVIALLSSMVVFGERLAANEWAGIALIGVGLGADRGRRRCSRRRRVEPLPAEPTPLDGGDLGPQRGGTGGS